MAFKLFIIQLITLYLAFQLQQTNATFLVESATGKALIQSACSASDSPPACYAVLNPVANNPNLNPTDICTVALQAASNIAKIAHDMLSTTLGVTAQIARDPSVRQSVLLCTNEYAQVIDLIDKSATALTQKVDEDKVPEYLSTAIASVAKCDASAIKVANTAVQITNKNVDCSKMLKNALGIYKVFAEYIENPSHDPKQFTGSASGNIGHNFNFDAEASDIIGLSAPINSPTPEKQKGDASGGKLANDNTMRFSFAKRGEFKKEFSAALSKGNVPQKMGRSLLADNSAGSGSTPSHVSASMKFSGLGLRERFKDLFSNNADDSNSGSSAGDPQSGSSGGAPVDAGMKFGLGLGLGEHLKGLFSHNAEDSNTGSSAGLPQSESSAGEPQSGSSTAAATVDANTKFGLGLGLGEHIKGFFSNNAEDPNSGSNAGALQSGSSADAPLNAGSKFSLSDLTKSFTSSKKHDKSGSPSPAPANAPSSRHGASAPITDVSVSDAPADGSSSVPDDESSSVPADAPNSVPDDASSYVPADAPNSVPADASSSVPDDASSSVPDDETSSVPADGSSSAPADASSSVPDDASSSVPADASDDGLNSFLDDDATEDSIDSPSPSPSDDNENGVSLTYSISHLIPDT